MKFSAGGGAPISPWHDIPLYAGDGLLNFICEILRGTSAKMDDRHRRADEPHQSRCGGGPARGRRGRPGRRRTPRDGLSSAGETNRKDTKDGALRFYPYNNIYISSARPRRLAAPRAAVGQ